MTSAQRLGTPLPVGSTILPGTLRAKLEEARAQGRNYTLKEAVGIIVPLAVEIADRHIAGEMLYVHPSSVIVDPAGQVGISPELAQKPPTLPRDKVCMAPEERQGRPGNSRSSVYAVGAILYELVTGSTVGPGMRRPTEVVRTLPKDLEVILAKSLVADPLHRPDDLKALAQALHHLAPQGSIAPPPADESHLDHDENFAVDVSLSMLPPSPSLTGLEAPSSPYDMGVAQAAPSGPRMSDSTTELAALKARLERDKRPRYVVIKEGMDHGPFSAVELLQQIGSHTFLESDVLRDAFSKDERAIRDWDEFAPFAEHARLNRDIKAEKDALERTVVAERKSTTSKALIGTVMVGVLVVVGALWFIARRGAKSDDIAVHGDLATNVESDGGLKSAKRAGSGKGGVVGVSNGIPMLSGGMSCEGAVARYNEEITIGGTKGQADLTAGQFGAVLNRGSYFAHCGVPESMEVNICAAVQNGRAVGVSVTTNPRNGGVAGCVASSVRGLSFPSNPKLDVTRTSFK
jgi:eukaryotic-like serine/threonine-protein kinase